MHQAMRLAGKLGSRGSSTDTGPGSGPDCCHVADADSSTATSNHCLFFLRDGESGRRFLIDTGSSFSILPYRSAAASFGPKLRAANGHAIHCWGTIRSSLRIGKQVYHWLFIRADVRFPILGIDFLTKFDLLVDVAANPSWPARSCSYRQRRNSTRAVAPITAWQPPAARRRTQFRQQPQVHSPLSRRRPPAAQRQVKLRFPPPNGPSCLKNFLHCPSQFLPRCRPHTAWNIISRRQAGPPPPNFAAWMPLSWRRLKRNSTRCWRQV
jgi:hypothetical protein